MWHFLIKKKKTCILITAQEDSKVPKSVLKIDGVSKDYEYNAQFENCYEIFIAIFPEILRKIG